MDNNGDSLEKWLAGNFSVGASNLPGMHDLLRLQRYFIDAHASDLFPASKHDSPGLLSLSCDAFLRLTQLLEDVADQFMVILAVPLQPSDDPHVAVPHLDEIAGQMSATPPTLYVANRHLFRLLNPQELHRRPLRWDPIHSKTAEAYVSYRVSRSHQGCINDWEFDRSIEVEHYPPSLIPTDSWQEWLSFVNGDGNDIDQITRTWREKLQRSLFRTSMPYGWLPPSHAGEASGPLQYSAPTSFEAPRKLRKRKDIQQKSTPRRRRDTNAPH